MEESKIRVKFKLKKHSENNYIEDLYWKTLAKALDLLDKEGFSPKMSDGQMVGNVGMLSNNNLIVSKSGRTSSVCNKNDFVSVTHFDPTQWIASYSSNLNNSIPTSDTPLYWAALIEAPKLFNWEEVPHAAIHGHALMRDEDAEILNIPHSGIPTEFSTPSDRESFLELLKNYPYPRNKVFIRNRHGFFVLAQNMDEAIILVKILKQKALANNLI